MSKSVAQLINDRMGDLRPSERKVARALLADYPRHGLITATALAAYAGVSAPTVVRFASALGFEGYHGLQAALLDEIARYGGGPLARVASTPVDSDLRQEAEVLLRGARESVAAVNSAEWSDAVALLADLRRPVTLVGGRSTMAVAEMLAATLEMVRSDIHLLTDPARRQTSHLLDLARRDVVLVYDVPRYQESTITLAEMARRHRASVIVVTDPDMSPAARHADVVIPVSVASPTPFAGMTAATVISELLAGHVQRAIGEPGTRRLEAWEEFRRDEVIG